MYISPQLQQLEVRRATKTKDNVLVDVVVSVQYRTSAKASAFSDWSAFSVQYLAHDAIKANVTKLNLDEVLQRKNEIAKAIKDELDKKMSARGFGEEIVQLLIVDIEPAADEHEELEMNDVSAGKFWGRDISYQNQTCGESSSGNRISDPSHLVLPPSMYSKCERPSSVATIRNALATISPATIRKALATISPDTIRKAFAAKPVSIYQHLYGDTPAAKWVPFDELATCEFVISGDDEELGGGGETYYDLKVGLHFQARVSTDMQLKRFDDPRCVHLVWNGGEWVLEFLEDGDYRSFVKEFEFCLLKNSPNAPRKIPILVQSSPEEVHLDQGFRRLIDERVDEAKLLLGLSASACYASPFAFPRVANGLGFAASLMAVYLRHKAGGACISILVKFGAMACAAGILAAMAKDLPQDYILAPIVAFLIIAAVVARAT